jgi:hypothetical protein
MQSSIVLVSMDKKEPSISIYPTVVENRQFNLRFENAEKGTYTINAINAAGQNVFTKNIIQSGGSSVETIKLPSGMAAGVYKVRISGKEKAWTETVILK